VLRPAERFARDEGLADEFLERRANHNSKHVKHVTLCLVHRLRRTELALRGYGQRELAFFNCALSLVSGKKQAAKFGRLQAHGSAKIQRITPHHCTSHIYSTV
jgi:hypothetical protein